jgi:hypothetical protein
MKAESTGIKRQNSGWIICNVWCMMCNNLKRLNQFLSVRLERELNARNVFYNEKNSWLFSIIEATFNRQFIYREKGRIRDEQKTVNPLSYRSSIKRPYSLCVRQCKFMKFDHCLKECSYILVSSKYNLYSATECLTRTCSSAVKCWIHISFSVILISLPKLQNPWCFVCLLFSLFFLSTVSVFFVFCLISMAYFANEMQTIPVECIYKVSNIILAV